MTWCWCGEALLPGNVFAAATYNPTAFCSETCAQQAKEPARQVQTPNTPSRVTDLLVEAHHAAGAGPSTPLWALKAAAALSVEEKENLVAAEVSTLSQVGNFSPRTKEAMRRAAKSLDLGKLETAVLQILSARDANFAREAVAAENLAFRFAADALRMAESQLDRLVDNAAALATAEAVRLQPQRGAPSTDVYPTTMPPKKKQNSLLADCFELLTDRRGMRGESATQFERYKDGLVLVLDAETFGTTKTMWSRAAELQLASLDRFVVPNPSPPAGDFPRLALHLHVLAHNEQAPEWRHIRLQACTSHWLIDRMLSFTAGPVFRCVYLDYTGTWRGRSKQIAGKTVATREKHERTKLCDPSREVRKLFRDRRFFDGAVLAITVTLGHGEKGHKGYNVAPTITNFIYTVARQNGYKAVRQEVLEYYVTSPMVLLIFAVYVSDVPPELVLGGQYGGVPNVAGTNAAAPPPVAAVPPGSSPVSPEVGQWYQLPGVAGLSRCVEVQGGGWRTFYNSTVQQTIKRQYRRDLLASYLVVPPNLTDLYLLPMQGAPAARCRLVGESRGGWKHFVREEEPEGAVPFKRQISKQALQAIKTTQ